MKAHEELRKLMAQAEKDHPQVTIAIESQREATDEVERLRCIMAEAESTQVIYHLTAV